MTTAFELGKLTARVKVAADPQTATAIAPAPKPATASAPEPVRVPKPVKPASPLHAVPNDFSPDVRSPPWVGKIPYHPDKELISGTFGLNKPMGGQKGRGVNYSELPYFGSEATTRRFVPQTPFPERDIAPYANLLKKYYDNDFESSPPSVYPGPELGTRGYAYAAADKLYPSKMPVHALGTIGAKLPPMGAFSPMQGMMQAAGTIGSGLQTYARGRYEQRLKNMRDTAFKDRTSTPFYYTTDPRDGDPGVLSQSSPIVMVDNTGQKEPKPTASVLQSPTGGLQFPQAPVSMNTPATDLHEHVHTTQFDPEHHNTGYPKRLDPRGLYREFAESELPAVTSEAAHVSDAYNYATGQWPEGMHLGMTMQQLTEDLRRRGHIGGATQMSTIMNDPAYRRRLERELNSGDPVYKQRTEQILEKLFPRAQQQVDPATGAPYTQQSSREFRPHGDLLLDNSPFGIHRETDKERFTRGSSPGFDDIKYPVRR